MRGNRTAVIFHYYERDKFYRENLIFFLSLAYRSDLHFYIVVAGDCSIDIPKLNNIKCIRVENKNNDYGGYSAALPAIMDASTKFDYFFFVNSSVRGPFHDPGSDKAWVDLFRNKMTRDVCLVGSSINIVSENASIQRHMQKAMPDAPSSASHVQTTAYMLSAEAVDYLCRTGFFRPVKRLSKQEVILNYEIGLSQAIRSAGWDFKCLLPGYDEIDYRRPHTDINPTSRHGDPLYRGAYFGRTAKPEELVFIKIARNMLSNIRWHWITFKYLLKVRDATIVGWHEYRMLRRSYALKVALIPVSILRNLVKSRGSW